MNPQSIVTTIGVEICCLKWAGKQENHVSRGDFRAGVAGVGSIKVKIHS